MTIQEAIQKFIGNEGEKKVKLKRYKESKLSGESIDTKHAIEILTYMIIDIVLKE